MKNVQSRGTATTTQIKAVIYCRVSTEEQTKNLSLETQEKQCREYCQRNGYNVVKVFIEKGESAKTADRTQFKEMISYCREQKGRVQKVIVYALSRFSRSSHDHAVVRMQLTSLGIGLRSVTEAFDDSAYGKMMESMIAAFAQLDNDVRSDRTKVGMQAAIAKGRWPFKPPIGYRSGRKIGPSLVVDPERGPLIRDAFVLFSTGLHAAKHVLDRVTNRGLRTERQKPLSLQTFNQLLRKPVYSAWISVEKWGEPVRGNFPPLVEQDVFDKVQAVLAGKRPRLTAYQKNHPEFPLRRFVQCGCCGKPLTGAFVLGRAKRRYGYYHCHNKTCRRLSVRKEQLEGAFLTYLERLQPNAAYMRLFNEVVLEVWRAKQREELLISVALKQNVSKVEARLQLLREAFIYDRKIDQNTYNEEKHKLEEQLTLLGMELRDAQASEADIEGVLTFAETVMTNAARMWMEFSLDQKQRFQRVLFPQGVTFDGEKFQTTVTCPVFNGFGESGDEKSRLATLTGFEPVLPP
jgi:site-specific DNA recombinase